MSALVFCHPLSPGFMPTVKNRSVRMAGACHPPAILRDGHQGNRHSQRHAQDQSSRALSLVWTPEAINCRTSRTDLREASVSLKGASLEIYREMALIANRAST